VSGAFPSFMRSIVTELYLCQACFYIEIEDGNALDRNIVVLGLQNECNGCHCRGCMKNQASFEQEGHDRPSISLPANQYRLVSSIKSMAGKPSTLLCVFVHGGSFALASLLDDCTAILTVWLPGQEGGAAFSDVRWPTSTRADR
jgi:hypothetical protein